VLYQLSYGPSIMLLCCPASGGRRDAPPWHRESRFHVLRARRPPATAQLPLPLVLVAHLLVSGIPQTKIAPPGLGAGGAIVSLPAQEGVTRSWSAPSRSTHANLFVALLVPVPRHARPGAASALDPARERESVSAPNRSEQAHVAPQTGTRGPRPGRREERVRPRIAVEPVRRECMHRSRTGVVVREWLRGGTNPPETKNRAADVLPER